MLRNILLLLAGLLAGYVTYIESQTQTADSAVVQASDRVLDQRQAGQQVQGRGRVTRVLPDDNEGHRHQRFILELASGQTVLVAHNIDLAPRIASLRSGDTVSFNGEFEWNSQGGVVHWTHKASRGNHEHGWLEHNGKRYQ